MTQTTLEQTLAELESKGSEQARKTYTRHGVVGLQFGVSFADLGVFRKRIKRNDELARGLWASGIHDARVLATMVADPAALTADELDSWSREINCGPISVALGSLVAQSPDARALADRWIQSPEEWPSHAGWLVIAQLAMRPGTLTEDDQRTYVERIERDIHSAPNQTRDAMNSALIAIGGTTEPLRELTLAAAARIGKVVVDHGNTACKTPDASGYIGKMWARKEQKLAAAR